MMVVIIMIVMVVVQILGGGMELLMEIQTIVVLVVVELLDPTPAVPDSYDYHWVLNDTDADDACTSNVHDCAGVCDGPGSTATTDGACCNSGNIDCTGTCEGSLFSTNYDGIGNDCSGLWRRCTGISIELDIKWWL